MLIGVAGFEWDHGNRDKSLVKHGVSCQEAEEAFMNWYFMTPDEAHSTNSEQRFILLGETHAGRRLTIVFTIRENRVRVISARSMSKQEGVQYEAQKEEDIH